MPRFSCNKTNFTAGELSERTRGRVDIDRYGNGVKQLYNQYMQPQGGTPRRPGTRYVATVKDSTQYTQLVRFEFSSIQAYVLEFGNQYFRVYKDGIQVQVAGVPVEFVTDYLSGDLSQLSFTQSADTLYVFHNNYPPVKITRSSHTSWTYSQITFLDGPYQDINKSTTTITTGAGSGTGVAMSSSAPLFAATDVGRIVRIEFTNAFQIWIITAFTDSQHVTVSLVSNVFSGGVTNCQAWRLGAFSGTTGYPACGTFFQQRFTMANTTSQPQTSWLSNSADFYNFAPTGKIGTNDLTVNDNNAMTYTINSNQVNPINWMEPGYGGDLLLGTLGSLWRLIAANIAEPLTPTNIQVTQQGSVGAAKVAQLRSGIVVIFVQRYGRKLKELTFQYILNLYDLKDLTLLAEHIPRKGLGIFQAAYQEVPNSIFWFVMNDGSLAAMTYLKEQQVIGWHRHVLGGTYQGGDPWVDSVCTVPASDQSGDQTYLIVKRTINGNTVRYIEFIEDEFDPSDETDKNDMFFIDAGLTYSGVPVSAVGGMTHLIGETVAVVGDGKIQTNKVVDNTGSIQLDFPASTVQAGLPYLSYVEFLPPNVGNESQTNQGKTQSINQLKVRLLESMTPSIGPDLSSLTPMTLRDATVDTMDASPSLKSEDVPINPVITNTLSPSYFIVQNQPAPLTILSVAIDLNVDDQAR